MRVNLYDTILEEEIAAEIKEVDDPSELPPMTMNWNFHWKNLFEKNPNARFWRISRSAFPNEIEGMLMLSVQFEEMLFMHNIEIAPQNIGKDGRYGKVAGCLIAYACSLSFILGKGNYWGFLTFESKTELIRLYMAKYGASLAIGQKMFIDPTNGKKLIKKYLGIDYDLHIPE